eukprot:2938818-Prorocentrum_lima.AAC.1
MQVGSLQWLVQKTRPDIACVVAIAASVQTKQPNEAQILLLGCWKLLFKTIMLGMCMEAMSEQD